VKISFRDHVMQALVTLVLCEIGMVSLGAAVLVQTASAQLSEKAIKQIELIQKEKESRSPIQKKIDSQLLYEIQRSSGKTIEGMPELKTGIELDKNGKVLVDVKAKVTDELLQQIKSAAGEVVYSSREGSSIRAKLPLIQIEPLAGNSNITFIEPAAQAQTQSVPRSEGRAQPKPLSRKNF
jgi:hypothetical protein